MEGGVWVRAEFVGFFEDALYRGRFGIESREGHCLVRCNRGSEVRDV